MFKINILIFLIVVSSSCINCQLDIFQDLPLEADSQEFDELEQQINNDIWDEVENQHQELDSPEKLLQKICALYDFEIKTERVECQDVKIVSKSLNVNNHVIHKRQAEDELEGSGDDSPIQTEEEKPEESDTNPEEAKTEEPLETTAAEASQKEKVVEENIAPVLPESDKATKTEEPLETTAAEASQKEKVVDENVVHVLPESDKATKTEEPLETTAAEASTAEEQRIKPFKPFKKQALEIPLEEPIKDDSIQSSTAASSVEITSKQEHHEEEKSIEDVKKISPEIKNEEATTAQAHSEAPLKQPELDIPEMVAPKEVPVDVLVKKQDESTNAPKLEIPVKEAESPVKEDEASSKQHIETSETKKDDIQLPDEEIILHQSGNAILNDNKDGMSNAEKTVRKMEANESIKSQVSDIEEPKAGATSEGAIGGKDTKLLIIIGGLVAAVGVAAFAYNVMKKRKATAAESRVPTQMNGNGDRNDPEEGREMKPLMKSPQPNSSVEYKDEK
uniref:A-kinase anchor protein 200-like n=1 Tax=Diabrotica virgifera virgifera TaxID=50390 RepID=A0A6P7HA73_DIAVI